MTLAKQLLSAAVLLFAGFGTARSAEVIVLVDGVEAGRGTVAVAMCDKGPLEECRQFSGETKAVAETLGYHFSDIPGGKYAFVATQDFDDSGENERNLLGMPKEPFAVGAPETRLVPPPTHADIATEIVTGRTNVIRMTLRSMTGTRKKDGAPTKAVDEVPLVLVGTRAVPSSDKGGR